jgi:hypothetical protein
MDNVRHTVATIYQELSLSFVHLTYVLQYDTADWYQNITYILYFSVLISKTQWRMAQHAICWSLRVWLVGILNDHVENIRPSRNKIGSINYFLQGKTLKYYNKISIFSSPKGSRYSVIISLLFSNNEKAEAPVMWNACHLIHMQRKPTYKSTWFMWNLVYTCTHYNMTNIFNIQNMLLCSLYINVHNLATSLGRIRDT